MTRYAVLLRGVNVGGRKLLMADFRELLVRLGCTEVKTLLASGQAVCSSSSSADALAEQVATALAEELGLRTAVMVRTGEQLAGVVEACPYPGAGAEGARHAVVFLERAPEPGELAVLEAVEWGRDEWAVHGSELYLRLPDGFADSKLALAVGKLKGLPATARNWNTVLKLAALTTP